MVNQLKTTFVIALALICLVSSTHAQDAAAKKIASCYMRELNAQFIENAMSVQELTPMALANSSMSINQAQQQLDSLDKICAAFNRSMECAGGRWWDDSRNAAQACDLIRCVVGSAMSSLVSSSSSSANGGADACTSPERLQTLFNFMAWGCTQPDAKIQFLKLNLFTYIVTLRQPRLAMSYGRLSNIFNNNFLMNGAICIILRSDINTMADELTARNPSTGIVFIEMMKKYMTTTITGKNPADCPATDRMPSNTTVPWQYLTMEWRRSYFPKVTNTVTASCDNSASMIAEAAQFALVWYESLMSKDDSDSQLQSSTTGAKLLTIKNIMNPSTAAPSVTPTAAAVNKGSAATITSSSLLVLMNTIAAIYSLYK